MYEANLYIAVAYILLCKLNYGYRNQSRFNQYLPNRTLFRAEFAMGYEKNMSILVIAKSP